MQGAFLRFYVHEKHRHRHRLLWEWLLEQASHIGIRGGSAFRAVAGFGRHHVLHENHFFDLAGSATVEVEFIATNIEAERLIGLMRQEQIRVFYTHIPARFGVISPEPDDPPSFEADETAGKS